MIQKTNLTKLGGMRAPLAIIEERLTILAQKEARLIPDEQEFTPPKIACCNTIVGIYKDDPEFAETERLSWERRESLRPKN